MKQKTFQFDDTLATKFEVFCRARMLVEKRAVSAALVHFMRLDATAR